MPQCQNIAVMLHKHQDQIQTSWSNVFKVSLFGNEPTNFQRHWSSGFWKVYRLHGYGISSLDLHSSELKSVHQKYGIYFIPHITLHTHWQDNWLKWYNVYFNKLKMVSPLVDCIVLQWCIFCVECDITRLASQPQLQDRQTDLWCNVRQVFYTESLVSALLAYNTMPVCKSTIDISTYWIFLDIFLCYLTHT